MVSTFYTAATGEVDNNVSFGSGPPTQGTWRKGDQVFNSGSTVSGIVGWTCIASGTPGTWLTFGNIADASGGAGAIVVAAFDAPAAIKARADYICDGVSDEIEINAAILASDHVLLTEGLFWVSAPVVINRDGFLMEGAGPGGTTIKALNNTITPMKIGTFTGAADGTNTKNINITIRGFTCEATGTAGSTVVALDIWGVSRFIAEDITAYRGYDAIRCHNLDRFNFIGVDAVGQMDNGAAWHLYQGVYDDVTVGSWLGGSAETANNGTQGIVFDAYINGGAETVPNVNEFNRLTFQGFRIGQSDTATGTVGVKFLCGARALSFVSCQWRYCRTQIDATIFNTANYTSMRCNFTLMNCSLIGTTANPATDVLKYTGPTNPYFNAVWIGTHFDKAVDLIDVTTGSPNIAMLMCECGGTTGITNLINTNAGAGTPKIRTLSPFIMGTARNYFSQINGKTATVPSGATFIDVTHGLLRTPDNADIMVTPQNNMGNATKYWTSNVGATTFRINVNVDPGATTAIFAWMINIPY